MKWEYLTDEQLNRLAECRSRKSDVIWIAKCYKEEKNVSCEDAMILAFEHLDMNGQFYDPTKEEYDRLMKQLESL